MLDGPVQDLTLARLDAFSQAVARLRRTSGALRCQRGHCLSQLVEMRIQILAIAALDGGVRDSLSLSATRLGVFAWDVLVVFVLASGALDGGRARGREHSGPTWAVVGRCWCGDGANEIRPLFLDGYVGQFGERLMRADVAMRALGTVSSGVDALVSCCWEVEMVARIARMSHVVVTVDDVAWETSCRRSSNVHIRAPICVGHVAHMRRDEGARIAIERAVVVRRVRVEHP